jgi:hypothetical protein
MRVAVGPPGVTVTITGVVATALVGVPGVNAREAVAEAIPVTSVPIVPTAGMSGVPLSAATVWLAWANCSIIFIGFSTEGSGETNNPVGIKVGVVRGACERDTSQDEISSAPISNKLIATRLCCL